MSNIKITKQKGGIFITSYEFRNDTMFLRNQFKSVGMFKLPLVKKQEISLEDVSLIGYDKVKQNTRQDTCTCRERRNIWSDCQQTLAFCFNHVICFDEWRFDKL